MFLFKRKASTSPDKKDGHAYTALDIALVGNAEARELSASSAICWEEEANRARVFLSRCSPEEATWILDAVAARSGGQLLLEKALTRGRASAKETAAAESLASPTQSSWSGDAGSGDGDPTSPPETQRSVLCKDNNLPVVQFSSQKYFCIEYEKQVALEVLRLQTNGKSSRIKWTTKDHTAVSGCNYVAASGFLEFGPDEFEKQLHVKIIDDVNWGGMLEFHVLLEPETADNCTIGEYLHTARVQRIDDEIFPTDKYREQILSGHPHEVGAFHLLIEYFRMNMSDPTIRKGTFKLFALGQFRNMVYITTLCTNIFLVDSVLVRAEKFDEEGKLLKQLSMLLAIVGVSVVTTGMLHYLDRMKFTWGVTGRSRMKLMCGLTEAFLNYTAASRNKVANSGELMTAMSADTDLLIKAGYMSFVEIVRLLGKVVMCIVFQASAPRLFGASKTALTSVTMALFPVFMAIIISARLKVTKEALERRMEKYCAIQHNVADVVSNFRLIADYGRRWDFMRKHESVVADYSGSDRDVLLTLETNGYYVRWLTCIFLGIFVVVAGMDVIEGHMSTGVFLTCLRVLSSFGSIWAQIYAACLNALNTAPSLERIIKYINMESDSLDRMAWGREQRLRNVSLSEGFRKNASSLSAGGSPFDTVSIEIKMLTVVLGRDLSGGKPNCLQTVLLFKHLCIQQGMLVSLVGHSGHGKSSLLRLLGGAVLPTTRDSKHTPRTVDGLSGQGSYFVPSHLRVMHCTAEPMFIRRGLLANLRFGHKSPDSDDCSVERIKQVLEKLGVSAKVLLLLDHENRNEMQDPLVWQNALSSSDKQLLHVARALISNPDVICLHTPTRYQSNKVAHRVFTALREFVDQRGLCVSASDNDKMKRRPTTCIMTCTKTEAIEISNEVYEVYDGGIERVNKDNDGHFQISAEYSD